MSESNHLTQEQRAQMIAEIIENLRLIGADSIQKVNAVLQEAHKHKSMEVQE